MLVTVLRSPGVLAGGAGTSAALATAFDGGAFCGSTVAGSAAARTSPTTSRFSDPPGGGRSERRVGAEGSTWSVSCLPTSGSPASSAAATGGVATGAVGCVGRSSGRNGAVVAGGVGTASDGVAIVGGVDKAWSLVAANTG